MARICSNCGRGALWGASRSHSNIKTLRRQHVNLQRATIDGRTVLLCTGCMRTKMKQQTKRAHRQTKQKAKAAEVAKIAQPA